MWCLIGRIYRSVLKLFKVLFKFLLLPDFGFFRTFTISFSFFFVFLLVRTHLEGMIWAFWEDMFYCWLTAGLWFSITATWSNLVINKAVSVTFFFFFKLCGVEKPLWIPWLFSIINEKLGNTIPSTQGCNCEIFLALTAATVALFTYFLELRTTFMVLKMLYAVELPNIKKGCSVTVPESQTLFVMVDFFFFLAVRQNCLGE